MKVAIKLLIKIFIYFLITKAIYRETGIITSIIILALIVDVEFGLLYKKNMNEFVKEVLNT